MSTAEISEQWIYRQPVEIRFGSGSLSQLSQAVQSIGGKHGLLVTSNSFTDLAEKLKSDPENRIQAVYHKVRPNPSLRFVDESAELIRTKALDFVVALGGGSVLDCAKAAAAIAVAGHGIQHYFGTGTALPTQGLPIIAIPTTAGTGSEVTSVSVLSDGARKLPLSAPSLTAKIAIVDPDLTLTLPPHLTASTGIDALCHAIEGFSSIHHQPICDTLAVRAASLILDNLETAVADGSSRRAREALAEASVIAGLAFALPKTTGPHACSYPLTAQYGIPHGEACGLTLEWFLNVNAGVPRVQQLARLLGYPDVRFLAERIAGLKRAIGVRTDLKDFALNDEQIKQLARDSQHPNLLNNPTPVTEEMLEQLYTGLAR